MKKELYNHLIEQSKRPAQKDCVCIGYGNGGYGLRNAFPNGKMYCLERREDYSKGDYFSDTVYDGSATDWLYYIKKEDWDKVMGENSIENKKPTIEEQFIYAKSFIGKFVKVDGGRILIKQIEFVQFHNAPNKISEKENEILSSQGVILGFYKNNSKFNPIRIIMSAFIG